MANLQGFPSLSGGGDDLLNILQASARRGTLLSSCEPDVKELMQQLDKLISTRCAKWENENARVTSLLKGKKEQVEYLQHTLAERDAEVAQLKCVASSRERDYLARSADCEAQLVRLRSEVTRISHSYEQLKVKRYHQRENKLNHELKQELERVKLSLHLSNEELRTAVEKVALLEADKCEYETKETKENMKVGSDENFFDNDQYIVLEPVQTSEASHLLEEMFDKHCHHLNHEIQKIFAN